MAGAESLPREPHYDCRGASELVTESPRRAGICLHISSLPSSSGIGDLGAGARHFIDWMAAAGITVWQFLPAGPTGYGNSPYQLLSAFAGNPLFIDLAELVELGMLDASEYKTLCVPSSARVDYPALISAKLSMLELAASRLNQAGTPELLQEYGEFLAEHDVNWLRRYAQFSTIKRQQGLVSWVDWEPEFRNRDPLALAAWEAESVDQLERAKRIQFLFFRQWRNMRTYANDRGVALFGDLPIYLAHDCADAWAAPELLDLDAEGYPLMIAGVPPDYFSVEGQRWGNPLYRWERHAADGYRWWVTRIQHAFQFADMVRLDHFRGFEAYWAIPAGHSARDGQWRAGPGFELLDAIYSRLGAPALVAEDLGIVTDDVTALRRHFHLPGMKVLQFLVGQPEFDPGAIDADCVCYTGTHDNDTVVGWFSGSGQIRGAELAQWQGTVCHQLQCAPEEVPDAMLGLALGTRAELVVLPLQDVFALDSEARMNTPGRSEDNWEWRCEAAQLDIRSASKLRAMIVAAGRLPAQDQMAEKR
jgi:4-alpha-glucanotransferase